MKIFIAAFQTVWMITSWAIGTLWREYMVDLHIDKWPWHPNDYIWFAERWNGRFAMFGVIAILQLELIYKESFWKLIGVL
jgi:hypothetical protein